MEGAIFAFRKPNLWPGKVGLEVESLQAGGSMVQGQVELS